MIVTLRHFIRYIAMLAAVAFATGTAAQPVNLTIGSFSQGSGWYVYAVNLAELLHRSLPPGSKVDAPPITGAVGNPRLVSVGKADLAFGMALVGHWARKGEVSYDKPMENLRALVGGWDQYYPAGCDPGIRRRTSGCEIGAVPTWSARRAQGVTRNADIDCCCGHRDS